ncbi:UDP-N-acetylglucosamine 2-epimerase (hydrolyzing) [Clostridiales bacterium]|nr:UDP-N-acetylglucosamine 2-epimerase (hydrolyzing) [Clostridiales bacterium]
MKKICVVTATRAEYGVLKNVIKEIQNDQELELSLIVTGTHLSEEFGMTVNEIKEDGFPISERVDILLGSDLPQGISKTMGIAFISFADLLARERPDMLLVLGDRYELIPICGCAMNAKIPIAHISGGETTEGAIDECVRHCVTKMSYLHFPGCEEYRRRIIQLGESPDRVFNFGDTGVENIKKAELLTKKDLEHSLNFKLDRPYASVTFHPVTLGMESVEAQCAQLFQAILQFPDMKFVFTKANSDAGGRKINKLIDEFVEMNKDNCIAYASLGIKRYLSLVKYSEFVLGNSSSGVIEAPCFHKPTVNVGDRQKGRLKAASVIDCTTETARIVEAMKKARSTEFKKLAKNAKNPYGEGDTAINIVRVIKEFLYTKKINLRKKFYDLEN